MAVAFHESGRGSLAVGKEKEKEKAKGKGIKVKVKAKVSTRLSLNLSLILPMLKMMFLLVLSMVCTLLMTPGAIGETCMDFYYISIRRRAILSFDASRRALP